MSDVSNDERLLDEIARDLSSVEAALARLDEDDFGRCEICQSRIDPGRLAADPLVRRCPDHA